MKKLIATHNKTMHADEVTAIALLKVFTDYEIEVERIDHEIRDFNKYDFVIDIGKKLDYKKYFDHHQYKGGKSSAGLIWSYLGLEKDYPKISKFIKEIDMVDVGEKKAAPFEYSSLIKAYNHPNDIYSTEQDQRFEQAIEFAMLQIISLKEMEKQIEEAKHVVANSYYFNRMKNVIKLEIFTKHWSSFINGTTMPQIKAVVWEDKIENNWKVKLTSKSVGSRQFVHGRGLTSSETMEFVHSSGFFAIAKTEEIMQKYLESHFE